MTDIKSMRDSPALEIFVMKRIRNYVALILAYSRFKQLVKDPVDTTLARFPPRLESQRVLHAAFSCISRLTN